MCGHHQDTRTPGFLPAAMVLEKSFIMSRSIQLLVFSIGLAACLHAPAADVNLTSNWPVRSPHVLHAAFSSGPGFSFQYEGERVGPALPAGWTAKIEKQDGAAEIELRHSSGLVARQRIRGWKQFEAVEYSVRFRNESSQTLSALGPIDALDVSFDGVLKGLSIVSSGGGQRDEAYPPASYALRRRYFAHHQVLNRPGQPGSPMLLTTEGGRSANGDLPFFFIENEALSSGLFVAVGWTGQWTVRLLGNYAANRLQVAGGMPGIKIRLQPGEEISAPTILLGCYRGRLADGSNSLRRLIRSEYLPKLDGKEPAPVTVYDTWWNINVEFDEALLQRMVDVAAEVRQEYFLLDAGWFAGAPTTRVGFGAGVGNWEEIDRNKFPNGLRPFADYVRSKGLKFGLWFEPERVARGSTLARQHPDWVIWLPDSVKEEKPYTTRGHGLLDYGRPEVRAWISSVIERYIRELGIRYIRHDFNMNPLAYWDSHDPEGRSGMTQIRHLEGLAQVIDTIRAHHPQVVIEGCASGGRRIDLETIRRFHTTWIGDHTLDPRTVRWNLHGLHHFLPGNYLYVAYSWPMPYQQPEELTEASLGAFFGGAFGTSGRIDQWPAAFRTTAAKYIALHQQLRRFLMEDFYPLTGQAGDDAGWAGWQFHEPSSGRGFVQAFRQNSLQATHRLKLYGLDRSKAYRFTDPVSGNSREVKGAEALLNGLEFRADLDGFELLIYEPK